MTKNEQQALLAYLDSQVMNLCRNIEQYLDPDAIGSLYDNAHGLLQDLAETLIVDAQLKQPPYTQLSTHHKRA